MTRSEIRLKMAAIYPKFMAIAMALPLKMEDYEASYDQKYHKFLELFKEYLQLAVQVQPAIPSDQKLRNTSNYLYALGIAIPTYFRKTYEREMVDQFGIDVGELSGFIPFGDSIISEKRFLERLYSDLDALKIQAYDSSITKRPTHEGFKIACFLEKNGTDFHFMRENPDGTWSQKVGRAKKVYTYDDIEDNLTEHNLYDYDYVKTLELVKPTIKR